MDIPLAHHMQHIQFFFSYYRGAFTLLLLLRVCCSRSCHMENETKKRSEMGVGHGSTSQSHFHTHSHTYTSRKKISFFNSQ